MGGIYDQGHLGSCTANALGAAFHFDLVRQGLKEFTPSRLFIYYNEREMEGNVGRDTGAFIRDGAKSLHKIGVCNEVMWPYDERTFTQKPSKNCYQAAAKCTAKEYARVPQTLQDLKACIHGGFPFVFGFVVYSSVQACGYNDDMQAFIVRNSWGPHWGDGGYFYMPYDYMTHPDLVSDIWVIRFVEDERSGWWFAEKPAL